MATSLQEGPVILIGYEYRLQLQAEADLFPDGASFAGQMRSAISAAAVLAVLSSAARSVRRVDDRTLEIILAPAVTGALAPGSVVLLSGQVGGAYSCSKHMHTSAAIWGCWGL